MTINRETLKAIGFEWVGNDTDLWYYPTTTFLGEGYDCDVTYHIGKREARIPSTDWRGGELVTYPQTIAELVQACIIGSRRLEERNATQREMGDEL